MKLFLTSAYETHAGLTALREFAMADRVRRHELSYNPEDADAILFVENTQFDDILFKHCLLYTSPSPRDATLSRMPSSA